MVSVLLKNKINFHFRYVMTGAREQKITIQLQPRPIFSCTYRRYVCFNRFFAVNHSTFFLWEHAIMFLFPGVQESDVRGRPRNGTSNRK